MTDNEIIQAMNYCCGNIEKDGECKEDMCYQATLPEDRGGDTRWCRQWLMKDALDLINRQKTEIERLRDYNENLITANKEFAERLKYYLNNNEKNGVVYIPKFIIDNLVKEMTEVGK